VYGELLKHATTSVGRYQLMCYRHTNQTEVDLVIEAPNGDLVGIEIKATASVQAQHLRGLQNLAKNAGSHFKMGVLLYDGTETLPLGNQLWAAPISSLWGV
jgi:predicted AAA+ superfamily ATPase